MASLFLAGGRMPELPLGLRFRESAFSMSENNEGYFKADVEGYSSCLVRNINDTHSNVR